MSLLEVRGVRKAFGRTPVLRGVDLDVPRGALAAVLGPSGCGKTTLLRVIAGFERLDAGTVTLGGVELSGPGRHLDPERRHIAVVPQEGALFPHLSVAGNVGYGVPRRGGRRAGRVAEMLDLVGLAGYGQRMPGELSGGQQQRVAVARALAAEPQVVLLDEPFSALDAGLRASVRADVLAAVRSAGTTAVLVTHDQEEALSSADLVAVVRDGVVVQSGRPEQVYARPRDLDVARAVGEAVVLAGVAVAGRARTALGDLELLDPPAEDGAGTVVLRPEQLVLVPASAGVPARVVGTAFYGHDASISLQVHGPDGATQAVLCRTQDGLPPAAEVGIVVRGAASWFPQRR